MLARSSYVERKWDIGVIFILFLPPWAFPFYFILPQNVIMVSMDGIRTKFRRLRYKFFKDTGGA